LTGKGDTFNFYDHDPRKAVKEIQNHAPLVTDRSINPAKVEI
jgi:hypothetical protein